MEPNSPTKSLRWVNSLVECAVTISQWREKSSAHLVDGASAPNSELASAEANATDFAYSDYLTDVNSGVRLSGELTPATGLAPEEETQLVGAANAAPDRSTALKAAKPTPNPAPTLQWSGQAWTIKTSSSAVGPGPNIFSQNNVQVVNGSLQLSVTQDSITGAWTCAEIIGSRSLGYGTYSWIATTPSGQMDVRGVLGLFTWSDNKRYNNREIDVEVSRWGNSSNPNDAQFVVQPYDRPGHLKGFSTNSAARVRHTFKWQPGRVDFESHDLTAAPALLQAHSYAGSDVPPAGDERPRINLWQYQGIAPSQGYSVTLESFAFTPL